MPATSLSRQDARHRDAAPARRPRAQVRGEDPGGRHVVRDVEDPLRRTGHDLEAAREPHVAQARATRPAPKAARSAGRAPTAPRAPRARRPRCAYWIAPPSAGRRQVAQSPLAPDDTCQRPSPSRTTWKSRPGQRASHPQRLDAPRAPTPACRRLPSTAAAAGAQDAGLLRADVLERRAQPVACGRARSSRSRRRRHRRCWRRRAGRRARPPARSRAAARGARTARSAASALYSKKVSGIAGARRLDALERRDQRGVVTGCAVERGCARCSAPGAAR